MDRSSVITLLSHNRYQDENGVWRDGQETQREVFCQVNSVSRAEFFAAAQAGMRPEYQFTMFFYDYQGETSLIYEGVSRHGCAINSRMLPTQSRISTGVTSETPYGMPSTLP